MKILKCPNCIKKLLVLLWKASSTRRNRNKLEICFINFYSVSIVNFDQVVNLFSGKCKRLLFALTEEIFR